MTICTAGREHYFGEIVTKSRIVEMTETLETRLIASLHENAMTPEMQLSALGQIAHQHWQEIPLHFPFIKLDAFVVMPNHVHGILVIDKNDDTCCRDAIHRVSDTMNENCNTVDPTAIHRVSDTMNENCNAIESDAINQSDAVEQSDAINRVSTRKPIGGITGENNPMLADSLSRVIRWYKGRTTFQCHSVHADFSWQTRFHDHIIRDENEFWKIREYILNNPNRWGNDKYNR